MQRSLEKNLEKSNNEFYTGNKSKNLLVHVMQNGIEVDKPVKAKIYEQSVTWNKRQWYIYPPRFIYDHKGLAHQYVDVNDVSVLTWQKDHADICKTCSKKMTIDSRQSRELGKRGVFQAIWGIDSTHMILLIIFAIGAVAMAGGFFWSYNQDTLHKTQLESANKEISNLKAQLGIVEPPPPAGTAENPIRR